MSKSVNRIVTKMTAGLGILDCRKTSTIFLITHGRKGKHGTGEHDHQYQ